MGNYPSSAAPPFIPSSKALPIIHIKRSAPIYPIKRSAPIYPIKCSAPIYPSPCPPNIAHYFLSEVPRFVTKSKLHWKGGVYYAYISFQGNELGGKDWCLSRERNFLSEGVRFGLSQK